MPPELIGQAMEWEILHAFPAGAQEAAWRECLATADYPSHYTAPEFFREPYIAGRKPFAILARVGERVDGVLTGTWEGRRVVCGSFARPQVSCRRDADRDAVARAFAAALEGEEFADADVATVHAWVPMDALRACGFYRRVWDGDRCNVVLDLATPPELLFKGFSESRRRGIRRAIKMGVEVTPLDLERDFAAYYEIYAEWCATKAIRANSAGMQRAAFELGGNRLILAARYEGRIVGVSTFRYQRGGLVEYAANCSRRDDTECRPNDLLMWRAIEWASAGGFRLFSMGGAHLFLRKFGGVLHPTVAYMRDHTLLRSHAAREIANVASIRMWRALPPRARRVLKGALRQPGEAE